MARTRVKLRLPDEDPLGLWQQQHHQAQQGASHSWQGWQQQHHQAQQGAQNRHDGQEQGPQTWEQAQQGPWQQGQQRPWAQSDQQSQQGTGTSQIASPPIATQQASGMLPHHQGPLLHALLRAKARLSEGRRTTVKAGVIPETNKILPSEQDLPESIGILRDRGRLDRVVTFRQLQALSNAIRSLGHWQGVGDFKLPSDWRTVRPIEPDEVRVVR